jgi:hypothetical protein
MRPFGVHVTSIDPFYINSGIQLEYICPDASEYKSVSDQVYQRRDQNLSSAVGPEDLVRTVNKILKSKDPKGMYISESKGVFLNFIARFLSGTMIERLTCKAVGLKY